MIKSFTVTNYRDESMTCELTDPYKTGFAITSITGIDPEEATINIADISSIDGGVYNSARIGSRNITISLRFIEYYSGNKFVSIEEIRHKCYRFFPVKKKVKLMFKTDTRESYISGYVEANDSEIFSKEEGAVISILCDKPFFYTSVLQENSYNDFALPKFYFPFYRVPSVQSNIKLIFGQIMNFQVTTINYEGEIDTGIRFVIDFTTNMSNNATIEITSAETRIKNVINISKIIQAVNSQKSDDTPTFTGVKTGDSLVLSTVDGNKYATFITNGIEYNVLGAISAQGTKWLYLVPGANTIRIDIINDDTADIDVSSSNKVYFNGV